MLPKSLSDLEVYVHDSWYWGWFFFFSETMRVEAWNLWWPWPHRSLYILSAGKIFYFIWYWGHSLVITRAASASPNYYLHVLSFTQKSAESLRLIIYHLSFQIHECTSSISSSRQLSPLGSTTSIRCCCHPDRIEAATAPMLKTRVSTSHSSMH